jgi:hypothetical protein
VLGSPLDRSRLGDFDEIRLLFALVAPNMFYATKRWRSSPSTQNASWVDQVVTAEGNDAVLQIGKTLRASYAKASPATPQFSIPLCLS